MKQFTEEILNHATEQHDLGEAGEILKDSTHQVLERIEGIINQSDTCDNVEVM